MRAGPSQHQTGNQSTKPILHPWGRVIVATRSQRPTVVQHPVCKAGLGDVAEDNTGSRTSTVLFRPPGP